jgi:hypothetical protein
MFKPNQYQTRIAITMMVTAAEFYTSASHIIATAINAGNPIRAAVTYPLVIDGMILAAVLALTARRGVNKIARQYAGWARGLGYAATLYCNVAASGFTSINNAVVDVFPGLGLILLLELTVHSAAQTPAAKRTPAAKPAKLRSVA